MNDVDVRVGTASDAEAIARFQTDTWREAYLGLVPSSYLDGVSACDRVQRWTDRIESKDRSVLIAWSGEAVVGVVSWGASGRVDATPPVVELKSLYVNESHRGTGLALRLLTAAIGDAPAELWVFRDNARAKRFYQKTGFRVTEVQAIDPDTGMVLVLMMRSMMR